ncbi:hypothetical protein LSAT2_017771 [Lamellibrachia satsuma]|nr:hypothetical protein LSAT2_017771 [Lamellibrachia satsuma]
MTAFRTKQNPTLMRGVAESGLFEKKVGVGIFATRIATPLSVITCRYSHFSYTGSRPSAFIERAKIQSIQSNTSVNLLT